MTLVQLFRFLQAKEIFIQQYILYLADRFLMEQYNGEGHQKELYFANLFKQECGDTFVSQAEQIIQDQQQRNDFTKVFHAQSKKKLPFQEFEFFIIDSAKWPIKNTEYIVKLPKQLSTI